VQLPAIHAKKMNRVFCHSFHLHPFHQSFSLQPFLP
jgi:hypothetical protein